MKASLLKAKAKKNKYLKRKKEIEEEFDSDGYISSDDEEQLSEKIIGKLIEDKYIILKYLGKGSFSETWMVYNIINGEYYALKIQIDTNDTDEFLSEINYLNILKKNDSKNVVSIIDDFIINFKGLQYDASVKNQFKLLKSQIVT